MSILPWNFTDRKYPTDLTLPQLIEQQVSLNPKNIAVIFKDTKLTYEELNRRANQLARFLRKKGVGPEKKVMVSMDRSFEVYIALVATQKAGGAYVPVEPLSPPERLKFYTEDCDPVVIITQSTFKEKFKGANKTILCIDSEWSHVSNESAENLRLEINEDNLSDIIYTSGSTGLPKGVLSIHKNRVNQLFAWKEIYSLNSSDILFQTTSLGFDVFTADYTRSLGLGATIVPSEENFTMTQTASIERMYELLVKAKVNFAEFNVTTIRKLLSYAKTNNKPLDFLRIIVVGADAWYLNEDTELYNYCNGKTRIINAYGMTEEAVDSVYFERSMVNDPENPQLNNKSLIGVPFPNTKVYLLDKSLKPVSNGEIGVMYFGGPNTARGYLNRDELTNERFISNPFETLNAEKIYNSGDTARIVENNILEFLGRIDFQVEIGSKRVEVSEVEAALHDHPDLREVVVTGYKPDNKETILLAYVSFHNKKKIDEESVKKFLSEKLPFYMIPSTFIIMDAFPLNSNGKVDRKKLPLPNVTSKEK